MAAISITASSVLPSTGAQLEKYVSAEAVAVGTAVYLTTAGTAGLADSDASGKQTVLGICVAGASAAGQQVVVALKDPSFTLGGTIASGAAVFSHTTAGAITATVADNTSASVPDFIGIGIGSNKIYLNPVHGGGAVP